MAEGDDVTGNVTVQGAGCAIVGHEAGLTMEKCKWVWVRACVKLCGACNLIAISVEGCWRRSYGAPTALQADVLTSTHLLLLRLEVWQPRTRLAVATHAPEELPKRIHGYNRCGECRDARRVILR